MMARAGEEIGVNLAVSLHAVTKEVRDEIVPLNRKYGIEELLQACADYPGANNARRITFEYVMLQGQERFGRRRARAGPAAAPLRPARQGEPDPVQPVAGRAVRMLDARADPARSATSSSRAASPPPSARPRGRDIDAACGQLKTAAEKKSRAQMDREAAAA